MEKEEMKQPSAPLTESHHSRIAPILGVLIIVLVLVFAGLYLWGMTLENQKQQVEERQVINNEPETPRAEADVQISNALSPSDELEAIEADLDGTNLDSIDSDLTAIDAELNAALGE